MYLVNAQQDILLGSRGGLPHVSMQESNLPAGTYYILVNSDEVGELYTHISCEAAKSIDALYMGQNRIIERSYTSAKGDTWNDKIIYYDELGREQETVQKGYTPLKKDLYSLKEYDEYGRLEKEWMPMATSANGSLLEPMDLKNLSAQSYEGDTHAYNWSIYGSSVKCIDRITIFFYRVK